MQKAVYKAYRVELDPNNKQIGELKEYAGTARYTWNWGLSHRSRLYKRSKTRTDARKQHKVLVKLKKTKLAWMYTVSKCVPQESLRDLQQAFENFFDHGANYPKFKKKGKSKDSFRLYGKIEIKPYGNARIPMRKNGCRKRKVDKNHVCSSNCITLFSAPKIYLPKIRYVKLKEIPKFYRNGILVKYIAVTISRTSDKWFASIRVKEQLPIKSKNLKTKIVGVDVGLKEFTILSNGVKFQNPKVYGNQLGKLRRLSKKYSRAVKGSQNQKKVKLKLSNLHYKIRCRRIETIHKVTNYLIHNYTHIVIEDLNIQGLMKNKKIARAIQDVGWYEFRRQLEYKSQWHDVTLMIAPRMFPSTKLCSSCGNKKKSMKLSTRVYHCSHCGLILDRDYNAAKNLENLGRATLNGHKTGVLTSQQLKQLRKQKKLELKEKQLKKKRAGTSVPVAGRSPETENGCGDGLRLSKSEVGSNHGEAATEHQTL